MEEIWVFIEQDEGIIEESSLGILGKARELGEKYGFKVVGVLLGYNIRGAAETLGRFGAEKVYYINSEHLSIYNNETYFRVFEWLIQKYKPNTILFSATRNGRDLSGRIAVRFGSGLLAHVIELDYDDEYNLVGKVPGFGGNIAAVVRCIKSRPQLATITPGVFDVQVFGGECKVENIEPRFDLEPKRMKIVMRERGVSIDISKSEKVVIAGMGTGGDLGLAKKLAQLIGAELGVTRPLADMGFASRDIQVGSTGVSLKSRLAIILGASGAPHFTSGIRDCDIVISINKDPEAPIKEYSDYFIVSDIFEVIPRLIKLLEG